MLGLMRLAGVCGLVAASLIAPMPAQARSAHSNLAARSADSNLAARSADFGPTAPGVSAIVVDAGNGEILSETNADTPRYPASLTKLMTLDLAFQALREGRISLDTPMPVSWHAASVEPVKLGLRPGSTITVRDAILAMVTMSANDAATVLGEYLGGGSEARFAAMMTLRAHALGMSDTRFANASGLPDPTQITTARDLSRLARDIVETYPEDRGFFETRSFMFGTRAVFSNDQMLKLYPGATGMKTGYTFLARHNLVTSAERDGHTLIGVLLHDNSWGSAYAHMTAMLDQGFGGGNGGGLTVASLPTLIPSADAAEPPGRARPSDVAGRARPSDVAGRTRPSDVAGRTRPAGRTAVRMADTGGDARSGAWAAQLGAFPTVTAARHVLAVARPRMFAGIARVAAVPVHGRTLWTAQITGLSRHAAVDVCRLRRRDRLPCMIVAPNSDELASR